MAMAHKSGRALAGPCVAGAPATVRPEILVTPRFVNYVRRQSVIQPAAYRRISTSLKGRPKAHNACPWP